MPQSLVKNYIHVVFSTKNRQPFIDESIEQELFNYLGGICKNMECWPVKIGGHVDHVHILCILSKKVTMVKLLEEIKKNSSKWIKTKGDAYKNFYWQSGYGAFSVNPAQVDIVAQYIENQKEHHAKKTFQKEYLSILSKYKIEYDPQFIWD